MYDHYIEDAFTHCRMHPARHDMCHNCSRNEMKHADGKMMAERMKLLELLASFASPASKHSSVSEVTQALVIIGKFHEVQVLIEAEHQVLMHFFREGQVHIL